MKVQTAQIMEGESEVTVEEVISVKDESIANKIESIKQKLEKSTRKELSRMMNCNVKIQIQILLQK